MCLEAARSEPQLAQDISNIFSPPLFQGPPTLPGVAECLIPSDGSACTACVPPLPAMGTFSGVHDNTQSPQCPTSMGGANETKPGAILYNKVLFFFPFDKKH